MCGGAGGQYGRCYRAVMEERKKRRLMDWSELEWSGLDRTGPDRTELN